MYEKNLELHTVQVIYFMHALVYEQGKASVVLHFEWNPDKHKFIVLDQERTWINAR